MSDIEGAPITTAGPGVETARLDVIANAAREELDAANRAREGALSHSRELIRVSANSIRASHRREMETAAALLERANHLATEIGHLQTTRPDVYFTGYSQDALKEYAEARCVFALINREPIPDATALGIPWSPYLNGLGETVGEMRRYSLDLLRLGEISQAEAILDIMDAIYTILVTIDYPDAITGGLRRTTDMARGILERTRADLTTAVVQDRLDAQIRQLSRQLQENQGASS